MTWHVSIVLSEPENRRLVYNPGEVEGAVGTGLISRGVRMTSSWSKDLSDGREDEDNDMDCMHTEDGTMSFAEMDDAEDELSPFIAGIVW